MVNTSNLPSSGLVGTASDDVPAILAEGDSGIGTLFLSLSERHPAGADAEYLRWHSLDHRPEQYRLAGMKASLRVVSTAECRAARAASHPDFDAVDHVMTYFFADQAALDGFGTLAKALGDAGRVPFVLSPVQRGVYDVQRRIANAEGKAGADVLPWRPARGVYLLVEQGVTRAEKSPTDRLHSADELVKISGVAGLWTADSVATPYSSANEGQRLTYLFLDGDPIATAEQLRPLLEERWQGLGVTPLLAAPFHTLVPWQWDRYLP